MYLLYCFLAFLSLSLHNASKNVGQEDGDMPIIYNSMGINIWFFITGLIVPAIVLFVYSTWYLAILYLIIGVVLSMFIANQYMYRFHVTKRPPLYIPTRADAKPSIIVSIISIVLLLVIFS